MHQGQCLFPLVHGLNALNSPNYPFTGNELPIIFLCVDHVNTNRAVLIDATLAYSDHQFVTLLYLKLVHVQG